MRNRKVQTAQVRNEQGCARARRGGHVSDAREAIRAVLLKHVDVSFTAADVQSVSRGVIEKIVGITDSLERSDLFSACRVVDEDFRWPPTTDEDSVIRLVEGHRKVRLCAHN